MKVRSELINRVTNEVRALGPDGNPLDEAGTRESYATTIKCIASDDPRLKEK
jgi:hypothetical protein